MSSSSTAADDRRALKCIDSELTLISNEIHRLLQRQEELTAERDAINLRLTYSAPTCNSSRSNSLNLQSEDFPWSANLRKVMRNVFKINELRPFQLPTMNALMNRQDCILIMPTGGGKSLCFQLPALLVDGVTLVISPLVSLMEDQVMALKDRGVEAEMLSSGMPNSEQNAVLKAMVDSRSNLKILYVTPERVKKSKRFLTNLEKMHVMGRFAHCAVDEVHCCSQWGHDFRPDYKMLNILKTQFPDVPILGLTATATTAITADVQTMLNIEGCVVFRATFNRPNLRYMVNSKPRSLKETVAELVRLVRTNYCGQSGIVYCFTVKESDELSNELVAHGIAARSYHASLNPEERSEVHRAWIANRCQIVVATIAFGMGIDKPDVRFVIHHSLSKSVENFYQESGRAGRDGKPADCIVFYRMADLFRLSTMVFQDKTGLANLYNGAAYCIELKRCRRAVLADYFGERWQSTDCNKMCDNCNAALSEGFGRNRTATSTDVTQYCRDLLSIVEESEKKKKSVTALQLMTAWSNRLKDRKSSGSNEVAFLSQAERERIFVHLLIKQYFKEKFHFTAYTTVSYIARGSQALSFQRSSMPPIIRMDLMQKAETATAKPASSSSSSMSHFARDSKTSSQTKASAAAVSSANKNAWLQATKKGSTAGGPSKNQETANKDIGQPKQDKSQMEKVEMNPVRAEVTKVNEEEEEDPIDLITINDNSSSSMYDFAEWTGSGAASAAAAVATTMTASSALVTLSSSSSLAADALVQEKQSKDTDVSSQLLNDQPIDDVSMTADYDWDDDVFGHDATLSPLLARPTMSTSSQDVSSKEGSSEKKKSTKRNHSMDEYKRDNGNGNGSSSRSPAMKRANIFQRFARDSKAVAKRLKL